MFDSTRLQAARQGAAARLMALGDSTLDSSSSQAEMLDKSDEFCTMGVDTGRALHAVILRQDPDVNNRQHLVHLAICQDFSELDDLMKRFKVQRCVIDGMPETHATEQFARRHSGRVYLSFFPPAYDSHARPTPRFLSGRTVRD